MESVDENNDGQITFEEFKNHMNQILDKRASFLTAQWLREHMQVRLRAQIIPNTPINKMSIVSLGWRDRRESL